LLPRSFASGGFTCSLFGTSHGSESTDGEPAVCPLFINPTSVSPTAR
jgi:hypothetical protein